MPKNKSIVRQVHDVLQQKLRIGEQRHAAKQKGDALDGIFSWSTYRNYMAKGRAFAKWANEIHGCKTLEEARARVDDYLQY